MGVLLFIVIQASAFSGSFSLHIVIQALAFSVSFTLHSNIGVGL